MRSNMKIYLFDRIWKAIRADITEKKRSKIALRIVKVVESYYGEDWGYEALQLMEDIAKTEKEYNKIRGYDEDE